ncbi:hypothetical protein [Streptomyces sp. WM6378]|uniref:hypothetical protein n=1 Tax=Streptomyces sp. WM6378 TaxID=1415557 RepID=UPI000AD515FB|nr:hypothetical protein [Streptomyces sp. WM6378]
MQGSLLGDAEVANGLDHLVQSPTVVMAMNCRVLSDWSRKSKVASTIAAAPVRAGWALPGL